MKRNCSSLARCIAGRAFAISILTTTVTGAYAQPPPQDAIVAESYAQMYQVSPSEAARRLALTREAGLLGQRLEREIPQVFSGLYVEHRPEFRIVVQFTEDAQSRLAAYTREPVFVAKTAPRSLELLLAIQAELGEQLKTAGVEFESGIDIKHSEINLYVLDPVVAARVLSRLLSITGFIKIHSTTGFQETLSLSGGNQLTGPTRLCSSGFNVVETATRELGLSTAGHCEDSLSYANPSVALVFQSELDIGSYDMQWHTQPAAGVPEQQLNDITVGGSQIEITSVTPSSAQALGDIVCKSGITTGHTCGVIVDTARQTMYNGEIGSYILVSNPDGLVMAEGGDSGGPVFGGNSAYGLAHARGEVGTPTRDDLYFMPIEHLSLLGVSVLTEPFEIETITDVTGSPPSLQVDIDFKGYPRFPVEVTVDVLGCPAGWTCTGGTLQYVDNVPSPLSYDFGCTPADASDLPVVIGLRTSVEDASGITPPPIDHTLTCIAEAPLSPQSTSEGAPRAGLLGAN